MAKNGMAFFRADTDRFRDIKIRKLVKAFSVSGYAVYDYVLTEIYRDQGCFIEWDDSTVFDVAEYFGIKEKLVSEIVGYCCVVGLFDQALLASESILTSKSIQERYLNACAVMKRKDRSIPERVKIPEETPKIPEETPKVPEVSLQTKLNQTKSNQTKPNLEARDFVLPFADDSPVMKKIRDVIPGEPVRSALRNWTQRVFDLGLVLDEISIGLHLKDLFAISTEPAKQLETINQSVKRGWKGFYPHSPNREPPEKKNQQAAADLETKTYRKGAFG